MLPKSGITPAVVPMFNTTKATIGARTNTGNHRHAAITLGRKLWGCIEAGETWGDGPTLRFLSWYPRAGRAS